VCVFLFFYVTKKTQAPCCIHHIVTFLIHCNQKRRRGGYKIIIKL
jgi:hypothetical protein